MEQAHPVVRHAQLSLEKKVTRASSCPVFPGPTFATPWRTFDLVKLPPGEAAEPRDEYCEQGFLVLKGEASFEGPGGVTPATAGTTILAAGASRLRATEWGCTALSIGVDMPEAPPPGHLRVDSVDAGKLTRRPSIHGGGGEIATRHIWGPGDFSSSWTFLDHAILSRGSAVGYHYHEALEECFVILQGRGYMTIDGDTFPVGPGSATYQGIGEGHGIYNPDSVPLDFLRIAVAMPGEEVATIDIEEDLSARTPSDRPTKRGIQ